MHCDDDDNDDDYRDLNLYVDDDDVHEDVNDYVHGYPYSLNSYLFNSQSLISLYLFVRLHFNSLLFNHSFCYTSLIQMRRLLVMIIEESF